MSLILSFLLKLISEKQQNNNYKTSVGLSMKKHYCKVNVFKVALCTTEDKWYVKNWKSKLPYIL